MFKWCIDLRVDLVIMRVGDLTPPPSPPNLVSNKAYVVSCALMSAVFEIATSQNDLMKERDLLISLSLTHTHTHTHSLSLSLSLSLSPLLSISLSNSIYNTHTLPFTFSRRKGIYFSLTTIFETYYILGVLDSCIANKLPYSIGGLWIMILGSTMPLPLYLVHFVDASNME